MTRNPRRTCNFSFYPGKNLSLSLFLTEHSLSLFLTVSFVFQIFSIVDFYRSLCDRSGRRRIVEIQRWTFFFFNFVFLFVSCFLQFWREIQLSQSKGIISDNLRLVPSFLFFSINDIFPEVFFSFFLRFRFALFICRPIFIFLSFFVPLASNFARILFALKSSSKRPYGKILTSSLLSSPSPDLHTSLLVNTALLNVHKTDVKIKIQEQLKHSLKKLYLPFKYRLSFLLSFFHFLLLFLLLLLCFFSSPSSSPGEWPLHAIFIIASKFSKDGFWGKLIRS